MGCCGDREKGITVSEQQKWDYITLSDFRSTSCLTPLSYAWLWILVFISSAVYAADAFTAVNLLAFNKWSSEEVKPKVSFQVAKWIFAGCIILSYAFLAYRWIRAIRVIRSGSVAECYLEPLAAIWQSMRLTKSGQGWRRFLVFAELTKSKKGVDYIALFVYFQFKGALIIILAQGPRIALNAITLWAVLQARLIPVGEHAPKKNESTVGKFFQNLEIMATKGNKQETVVYFAMLFSLVIWVIAALSLIISLLFYIFYLWHHVDKSDGSLTKYCRRKIETRLERIVSKKIKKALEKQDLKRRKEEQKAGSNGEATARLPTLPKLADDDTASMYSMSTTTTSLPPYSSNGPSRTNTTSTSRTGAMSMKQPSLPSLSERPMPVRSDTQGTAFSTNSNAPLLGQAADMGMSSPLPPMPVRDPNADYFNGPPLRGPQPNGRPFSPMSQGRSSPAPRAMPPRVDTQFGGRNSPAPSQAGYAPYSNRRPGASPLSDRTFSPFNGNNATADGPSYEMSPVDRSPSDYAPATQKSFGSSVVMDGYKPPQLPNVLRPGSPAQNQGQGLPSRAGTAPPSNPRAGLPATLQSAIQRREASQPLPFRGPGTPQQRSATAPLSQPGYGPGPTERGNSTAPPGQGFNGN